VARCFGDDADSACFSPTRFDIKEINNALTDLGLDHASSQIDLPEQLDELVQAIRTSNGKRRLRRLIGDADLDQPVRVDSETAAWMVHPYMWLLDRVGLQPRVPVDSSSLPARRVAPPRPGSALPTSPQP
jgi:hypothetical protein